MRKALFVGLFMASLFGLMFNGCAGSTGQKTSTSLGEMSRDIKSLGRKISSGLKHRKDKHEVDRNGGLLGTVQHGDRSCPYVDLEKIYNDRWAGCMDEDTDPYACAEAAEIMLKNGHNHLPYCGNGYNIVTQKTWPRVPGKYVNIPNFKHNKIKGFVLELSKKGCEAKYSGNYKLFTGKAGNLVDDINDLFGKYSLNGQSYTALLQRNLNGQDYDGVSLNMWTGILKSCKIYNAMADENINPFITGDTVGVQLDSMTVERIDKYKNYEEWLKNYNEEKRKFYESLKELNDRRGQQ